MMRKQIVAGNWKMNTNYPEALDLITAIVKESKNIPEEVALYVAPPFVHLSDAYKILKESTIKLGAQNCSWENSGAYTGEVSASMLKSVGCSFVILGHSERRKYFNEDGAVLTKKVGQALDNHLQPVFCCGEQLEERESGKQEEVVEKQLEEVVFTLSKEQFQKIIIAYEPVWAIGTGRTASPEQAQEMHAFIRKLVAKKYGEDIAGDLSILYGGSCKPGNAKELFAQEDVDGGLIGGASLKADDFIAISRSF